MALKLASSIFDRFVCLIKNLLDPSVDRNMLFYSVDFFLSHNFVEKCMKFSFSVYMIYIFFYLTDKILLWSQYEHIIFFFINCFQLGLPNAVHRENQGIVGQRHPNKYVWKILSLCRKQLKSRLKFMQFFIY